LGGSRVTVDLGIEGGVDGMGGTSVGIHRETSNSISNTPSLLVGVRSSGVAVSISVIKELKGRRKRRVGVTDHSVVRIRISIAVTIGIETSISLRSGTSVIGVDVEGGSEDGGDSQ